MRLARTLAACAFALATVVGCSSGSGSDSPSPSESGGATAGTDATADASFPQTVTTAFGDVTIDKAPVRVVALGWGDAETALALGVQPVGASDWLGFGGDGVGPWAQDLYTTSPQIIETMEPSFEKIAALKPDLILDTKSSGDKERYTRLSQIAPTVGVPKGGENYLTNMDQQMTMISTALGMPDKGKELLAEVDEEYAAAAEAHPQWKGKTITAAAKTSEGWGAYITGGGRVETLEKFGFTQNPTIEAQPVASGGFYVNISSEQLDLLNADVIVAFPIFLEPTAITDDPQWQALDAVKADHAIVIDGDVSNAFSVDTNLSAKYTIDHLVPLLEKAVPASS